MCDSSSYLGYASYEAGNYSPRLLKFNDVEEVIECCFFANKVNILHLHKLFYCHKFFWCK